MTLSQCLEQAHFTAQEAPQFLSRDITSDILGTSFGQSFLMRVQLALNCSKKVLRDIEGTWSRWDNRTPPNIVAQVLAEAHNCASIFILVLVGEKSTSLFYAPYLQDKFI